ncbi:MAG: hypothetical protein PsegKO_09580 [Pseudohongiellaceae bacterium]
MTAAFVVLVNSLFVYLVMAMGLDWVHSENALLENLQASLLAVSSIFYLWLAGKTGSPEKFLHLTLALLSFSFISRELDLERLPVPLFVQLVGSGFGRNLLLTLLWTWLLVILLKKVADKRQFIADYLLTPNCLLLAFALSLLIFSALIDRQLVPLEEARLFEELAETNAYIFVLLPALSRMRQFSKSRSVSQPG